MTPKAPMVDSQKLITIAEFARTSGMTEPAIRGRIAHGDWRLGIHYVKRGRRIMLDEGKCWSWFRGLD
jgi:hypothetical protein